MEEVENRHVPKRSQTAPFSSGATHGEGTRESPPWPTRGGFLALLSGERVETIELRREARLLSGQGLHPMFLLFNATVLTLAVLFPEEGFHMGRSSRPAGTALAGRCLPSAGLGSHFG